MGRVASRYAALRISALGPQLLTALRRRTRGNVIPTQTILDELQTLLAADTGTLAAVTALHVHLIKAPFVPSAQTDFTTLTPADFTGYAFIAAGTGTQQKFRDPITGELIVQMKEPAGGWHWAATGGANLPQTIYGWCLTDNADTVTYGSDLLPSPVLMQASGDGVDVDQVRFGFALQPLS